MNVERVTQVWYTVDDLKTWELITGDVNSRKEFRYRAYSLPSRLIRIIENEMGMLEEGDEYFIVPDLPTPQQVALDKLSTILPSATTEGEVHHWIFDNGITLSISQADRAYLSSDKSDFDLAAWIGEYEDGNMLTDLMKGGTDHSFGYVQPEDVLVMHYYLSSLRSEDYLSFDERESLIKEEADYHETIEELAEELPFSLSMLNYHLSFWKLPYSISEMLERKEWQAYESDLHGNQMWIQDPERAERIHKAVEFGGIGSTHQEVIEDRLSFIRDSEYPLFIKEILEKEAMETEQWHEENGSLHDELG